MRYGFYQISIISFKGQILPIIVGNSRSNKHFFTIKRSIPGPDKTFYV